MQFEEGRTSCPTSFFSATFRGVFYFNIWDGCIFWYSYEQPLFTVCFTHRNVYACLIQKLGAHMQMMLKDNAGRCLQDIEGSSCRWGWCMLNLVVQMASHCSCVAWSDFVLHIRVTRPDKRLCHFRIFIEKHYKIVPREKSNRVVTPFMNFLSLTACLVTACLALSYVK